MSHSDLPRANELTVVLRMGYFKNTCSIAFFLSRLIFRKVANILCVKYVYSYVSWMLNSTTCDTTFLVWFMDCLTISHQLTQCWHIGNYTLMSKFEIWIDIITFLSKKMHFNLPSIKWRPFCFNLSLLYYSTKNRGQWEAPVPLTILRNSIEFSSALVKNILYWLQRNLLHARTVMHVGIATPWW